ncbi:Trm112p-domain-containing protein [Gymnopus androsaceus JB14]|uniref:Trm112p-domain-containing protein n=1 Tax=Gymnopus androsaceus JB14 TaxID=1447944 RepID=A0A6A4IGK1_9AGAR|nr:Trm112p-domain-containing protein [Gymnopus androsaceus JB14]
MVRLITHNLLACHAKGCTSNNFPLQFQNVQIELKEAEFNPTFLETFMPKLEWKALVDSAKEASATISRYILGNTSLPLEQPEMLDEEFLKNLHHVLLEIHVEEGIMICPNCKHNYPISNGIPNMLLAEHEIG